MAENVFDNLRRVYNLDEMGDGYFPSQEVVKGLIFKKKVQVTNRADYQHARVSLTNKLLDSVGGVLNEKVEIAGIPRDDLHRSISQDSNFSMVDGKNKVIGSINYAVGVPGTGYYGATQTSQGKGVEVKVFGSAIKNPEQFNLMQVSLRL